VTYRPLILSCFPGVDLLGRAFEEEWPEACIVRGPDLIFGGDIRSFHVPAGRFDGIIGGPPCQAFSRLRYFVENNGLKVAENLIPEFERIVSTAEPEWFLMENVPEAPAPHVPGYHTTSRLMRDVWCGGKTNRMRRFTFGSCEPLLFHIESLALHCSDPEPTVTASGGAPPGWKPTARHLAMRKGKVAAGFKTASYLSKALRDQGLPTDFLDNAPFTVAGKIRAIGNGVPMALGRAVAQAVKRALQVQRTLARPAQLVQEAVA